MIITMLCTVVGGAILALPACLQYASLLWGILMLLIVAALSLTSAKKLCILADYLNENSYVGIFNRVTENKYASHRKHTVSAEGAFKEKFRKFLIQAVIFWYTFGIAVSFIVIIGDSIEPLASAWLGLTGVYCSAKFWILLVSPVLFLTSSVESITELHLFSLISFLTMIYVSAVVGIRYIQIARYSCSAYPAEGLHLYSVKKDIFQAFPILTVAYTMHYNIPQLYHELKAPSIATMNRALYKALLIIVLLYLQTAIMGYLHFGSRAVESGGDILALYSKNDNMINIGRFLMVFHFALGFPMVSIACRQILTLVLTGKEIGADKRLRISTTLIVVATSCLLAAYTTGITEVFVFNGVLFGIHIVMTIPAVLYYLQFRKTMSLLDTVFTFLLFLAGIIFSVVGFTVVLMNKLR